MNESLPQEKKARISPETEEAESVVLPQEGENKKISRTMQIWNAPLPPPEAFNKYPESIQNRIMDLVEKESESRHGLLKSELDNGKRETARGQHYTFFTVMAAILSGAVLVLLGYPYGLFMLAGIIPALGEFLEKLRNLFHSKKDGE